jgi:hypothetical protein
MGTERNLCSFGPAWVTRDDQYVADMVSNSMLLGIEAQRVVWLRMAALAAGGPGAQAEINQMVSVSCRKSCRSHDFGKITSFYRSPLPLTRAGQ